MSASQLKNQIRQAQLKQRQAIEKYNAGVRKVNRGIDDYNRAARAHNARVRSNRERLRREVAKINSQRNTTSFTVYQSSVTTLRQSFAVMEAQAEAGSWQGGEALFDLSEGEVANSAAVLNALLAEPVTTDAAPDEIERLQLTSIVDELASFDPDLDARWRGALFALHPANPDAGRHFCTSAREMLSKMLELAAPDSRVLAADPHCPTTPRGSVSRRARIRYCLAARGRGDEALEAFVEADLENVVTLFDEFNSGTHGGAGRFDLGQLSAIKTRVEDAVRFVRHIAGGS